MATWRYWKALAGRVFGFGGKAKDTDEPTQTSSEPVFAEAQKNHKEEMEELVVSPAHPGKEVARTEDGELSIAPEKKVEKKKTNYPAKKKKAGRKKR